MALTDVYGINYKSAFVTVPSSKITKGEAYGREHVMYEKFTFDADGAASETIKLGRLPAGAKVISARVFGPDLGGTGTFELGNSASVDGSATDALDVDSFIDAGDSSGQAFDVLDSASAQRGPAIGLVRFSTEVDVILTLTGATSGASTKSIYMILRYIVD
tara:strand:- start:864 stop:1346 length:483 start_codon:yes stop_codon:yes gene_type:complete